MKSLFKLMNCILCNKISKFTGTCYVYNLLVKAEGKLHAVLWEERVTLFAYTFVTYVYLRLYCQKASRGNAPLPPNCAGSLGEKKMTKVKTFL